MAGRVGGAGDGGSGEPGSRLGAGRRATTGLAHFWWLGWFPWPVRTAASTA